MSQKEKTLAELQTAFKEFEQKRLEILHANHVDEKTLHLWLMELLNRKLNR